PKLTLNVYTHLTLHDTAAALDALPDLTGPAPGREALAATGTDPVVTPISERLSLHFPYGGDGSGRELSDAGGVKQTTPDDGGCRNSPEMLSLAASGRGLSAPVASAPRRTRTYNPLIKSQAARRELGGSNSLRQDTLGRFWSRKRTTSLATFYGDL